MMPRSLRAGLMLGATLAVMAAPALAASSQPWRDKRLPADQRAALLVKAMTREEKLRIVHGVFPMIMKERPPGVQKSAGLVPGIARLGLPDLLESDASLGVAAAQRDDDEATPLPSGLSLAATWNPQLAYDGGRMIGKQTRQKGFNVLLAGGVNLVRDPRNGRNFEYLGEDVLLSSQIAAASIRGIQSNKIVSTTKHFALNAQETGRHVLNAVIDPGALRESDLLAFQFVIEQSQPGSVMCAYNRVNGPYACENPEIFNALKGDWGWKGWVMSDWGAVHSTKAAVMAGLDQQSGEELDEKPYFGAPLKAAIESGEIPEARLTDMAQRIAWGVFSSGLYDNPVKAGGLDIAADAPVAEQAAEQGVVLLKNDGALPLAAGARRIAVIGGHADIGVLSGGGSSQVIPKDAIRMAPPKGAPAWGAGVVYHASSPLDAIRRQAPGAAVTFDAGTNAAQAAQAAKDADVAIVFVTQWTTEALDAPLALADGQDAMVEAVAAANPRTIVVMETGGPVFTPWVDKVAGLMEAWYPGARGGEAIAKVLFGKVDASGRLPVTFPRTEAELPRQKIPGADVARREEVVVTDKPPPFDAPYPEGADVGYRWYERTQAAPRFPFGYGLSYSQYRYANLKVSGGQTLTVSFDVTNAGQRVGLETPQVYAAGQGLTHRLIGFKKLALKPGQTQRVTLAADRRLLSRFDTAKPGWTLAAGPWSVKVGRFAGDAQLTGSAQLSPGRIRP
ncbi:glycoside hydrolase family 3 protein [Caulobacter sp. Root1472]|uniref:beta-glucosidase n=1 Tax=Caulobacter sp. Root1472 TaxID=1736470 RepID=UPI0007021ADA|nr:glycoside hydrolase family 3 protein [Caulobacter sp. Root1472]KQZ26424.1 beta-glucosidase [Caulobacter sp. Root1472]